MKRGQALVEFALVLPILIFMLLGFAEVAFLVATQHGYQRGADVLADVAVERMRTMPGESWQAGWEQLVNEEGVRAGCSNPNVEVSFPDMTHQAGDRVVVTWSCAYEPVVTQGLWPGLIVSATSAAVIRS